MFTFFIRECLITRHNLFLIGLCASYYRTHVPFSAYVTKRSVRIWWILIRHFFLFREYRKQDWTLYWKMLFWFFLLIFIELQCKANILFILIVIPFFNNILISFRSNYHCKCILTLFEKKIWYNPSLRRKQQETEYWMTYNEKKKTIATNNDLLLWHLKANSRTVS